MNILKLSIVSTALVFSQTAFANQFEEDAQNFYVDGQSINDALGSVNEIVCLMSAMRPDAFVNDGAYRATTYDEDCETGKADAAGEQTSATATSSASSTTATASTAAAPDAKSGSKNLVLVTRADNISPVLGKVWVESASDDEYEPDMMIYVNIVQSAEASITSPNGDFNLAYSTHSDLSNDLEGTFASYGMVDGGMLGQGIIVAQGESLKYKEMGGGDENNIAATFFQSGDKQGIYGERAQISFSAISPGAGSDGEVSSEGNAEESDGDSIALDGGGPPNDDGAFSDNGANAPIDVTAYYQFYMSKNDKGYCRKLVSAESTVFSDGSDLPEDPGENFDWGAYWEPTRTEVYNATDGWTDASYATKTDLVQEEECFTTDRSKAQRNVYAYGVYNDDGTRLAIGNPGFPMRATVQTTGPDGESIPLEVHGYADYWGVHVDPMGRAFIDEDTVFTKETFNSNDTSTVDEATYNVATTDIRIEKRTTEYLPLNDIDGLNFSIYVNDSYWAPQFKALFGGTTPEYDEYEGSFDKDTKTFTLKKGLAFFPQFTQVDLETPVSFTIAEWQSNMKRTWGSVGDDWYYVDVRSIGVWSNDTRQWYDILPGGLENPDLASAPTESARGVGMRTESTEFITPVDLKEKLYCISDCLSSDKVQATMGAGVQGINAGNSSFTVPSPYAAVGEYLKEDATLEVVEWGFQTMSEATDSFNVIKSGTSLKFGDDGIAITDYVKSDINLPHYMRAFVPNAGVGADGVYGYRMNGDYVDRGLSRSNLNKLLSDGSGGNGIAPVLNIDTVSIPASGSGTMDITVTILEGEDTTASTGEEALIASTTLNWTSDGTTFTASLPASATTTVSLSDESGATVQGTRSSASGIIASGAVGGLNGITWNLFNLFDSTGNLSALYAAGVASFFEENESYTLQIKITNNTLTINGPDDTNAITSAVVNFRTYEDADVLRSENYSAGQRFDGVQASELLTYTASGSDIVDSVTGTVLTKGAVVSQALLGIENPESLLQGIVFTNNDGWDQSVAWGLRTGQLVGESDLAKMECRKNGKDELYDSHPVYGTSTDVKRYCSYKLWDGGIQTSYTISLEARPTYILKSASTGLVVNIDEPQVLYYTVPEELDPSTGEPAFGDDAGKRIRLDFMGHGQLHGIPGFVWDTKNGVEIGEFVNEWKEGYRYINRFTIPDGARIEDALDSSKTYRVKALDGEEWLTKADGTVTAPDGTLVADLRGKYTYAGSTADLLDNSDLRGSGDPNNTEDYIGAAPTELLNEGATSVVHGEVVFDPTPE